MQSLELARRYQYWLFWSSEDQEWVATVAEFPSLSNLDPDPGAAMAGLIDLVAVVIDGMLHDNEALPQPRSQRQ